MSEKSNKELAVELAAAVISSIPSCDGTIGKPITGEDIKNILQNCYESVKSLDGK